MNKLVISCVDGGPGGDAAARVGSSLARRLCSPLMLATVAPAAPQVPGRFDVPPSRLRQARSTLLRQARSIFGQAADGLGPTRSSASSLASPRSGSPRSPSASTLASW